MREDKLKYVMENKQTRAKELYVSAFRLFEPTKISTINVIVLIMISAKISLSTL